MAKEKTRYLIVRQDGGKEIYTELLSVTGDIKSALSLCKKRFAMIKKAMPKESWSMTVEQQWKEGEDSHFQIMDVETGELQEQVL
jgi:hypothetical protein